VLKHAVLALLLETLADKPKPLVYLESHAGSGRYDLRSEQALKTGEFRQGIARLWAQRQDCPELAPYLDAIAELNPDGVLVEYPGSPLIAAAILRSTDRLVLIERHPQEVERLRTHLGQDRRVAIHQRDGLTGLPALVPPKPARGLVLIDPSYEIAADYDQVADCLLAAHARWPTGVYALWYPRLASQRDRADRLLTRIGRVVPDALRCELRVSAQRDGTGLRGSGMLIVNPPWRFQARLESLGPRLASAIADRAQPSEPLRWTLRPLGGASAH
jgi:23S rRNA (adenine2030-N6)-methyltransferase